MQDHRCTRCGCQLKVEEVQIPKYTEHWIYNVFGMPELQVVQTGYETVEEVSDCPRCQGAY